MFTTETPLERVERELTRLKAVPAHVLVGVQELPGNQWREVEAHLGPWDCLDERMKLFFLERLDWRGVDPETCLRIMQREVDYSRVPDDPFFRFRLT